MVERILSNFVSTQLALCQHETVRLIRIYLEFKVLVRVFKGRGITINISDRAWAIVCPMNDQHRSRQITDQVFRSRFATIREAVPRHASLEVLVLRGFPEERYALAMVRNGASGYLSKDCQREDLLTAIRTVAQGRRYLSARTAELLAEELLGDGTAPPHTALSEREMQVFLRLAKGASVSEIADSLHLSVKTVSTYRTRLLEKLALGSNAALAAYALRNGLLME